MHCAAVTVHRTVRVGQAYATVFSYRSAMTDDDPRRYTQLAAVLRERITSGELATGDTMPGTRGISDEFGVSIETAQKALRVLEGEGLIRRYPGLPYYVL